MGNVTILVMNIVVATLVNAQASNDTVHWRLKLHNDMKAKSNRNVIPVKRPDEGLTAYLYFILGRIEQLDEKIQVLTTFGWISVSWTDELMQWDPADYGGVSNLVMNGDELWIPEIAMLNSVDHGSDLSLDTNFRVSIYPSGDIIWTPGMRWRTSCKVYLRYFPFDTQICEVQFISWIYGSAQQNLTYISTEVDSAHYVSNGEWDLISSKIGRTDFYNDLDSLPIVAFQLTMKRRSTYFALNLIVPAIAMSTITLLVFAVPPDSGEKISLCITVMLSYTVFLLMMSDITPRTSETTPILIIYIVSCQGLSVASLFCAVFVLSIYHHSPNQPVPNWARKWILRVCSYCLCLRRVKSNHEASKSETRVHPLINVENAADTSKGSEGKAIIRPSDLMEYLRRSKARSEEKQEEENNQEDWKSVAQVIDRFCLLLFTIASIIATSALLTASTDTTSDIDRTGFVVS